jgi:hypothetical protein
MFVACKTRVTRDLQTHVLFCLPAQPAASFSLHSSDFDLGILDNWLEVMELGTKKRFMWRSLDTKDLATKYMKAVHKSKSWKLGLLAEHLGVEWPKGSQAHMYVWQGCVLLADLSQSSCVLHPSTRGMNSGAICSWHARGSVLVAPTLWCQTQPLFMCPPLTLLSSLPLFPHSLTYLTTAGSSGDVLVNQTPTHCVTYLTSCCCLLSHLLHLFLSIPHQW